MKSKLSHVDPGGNPAMVNVSKKKATLREAHAQARVWLGREIMTTLNKGELLTRKGPVFQTAILAGIMGAKKTAELIPLCHPIGLDNCTVKITAEGEFAVIDSSATLLAKTGVEMEALTAAAVAALTIYDMCKAISHDIRIDSIQLISKTGGKKDFKRK